MPDMLRSFKKLYEASTKDPGGGKQRRPASPIPVLYQHPTGQDGDGTWTMEWRKGEVILFKNPTVAVVKVRGGQMECGPQQLAMDAL